ncbi:hypothetical protein BO99DRAFT_434499 [Aspergillus violaceofuscus CBS 115571]|uniref:Uncharacterized protein n=1 Tax=Aspergillus violaceofuscus (strain CBS 115571) TaxID=1450538 RepID=A0A2V5HZZ3_ASPV1|nr:hypothetical protein BO99DRAFT_434499 [Aspergillus violaceofuscus CBS 115571]
MAPPSNSNSPTPQAEPRAQSADSTPAISEKSTKPTGKILSAKPTTAQPTTQPATAQPRLDKGKQSSTWDNVGAEQVLSDIATSTSLFLFHP